MKLLILVFVFIYYSPIYFQIIDNFFEIKMDQNKVEEMENLIDNTFSLLNIFLSHITHVRKDKLLVFVFKNQWDIFSEAVGKIFEDLKNKANIRNISDVF